MHVYSLRLQGAQTHIVRHSHTTPTPFVSAQQLESVVKVYGINTSLHAGECNMFYQPPQKEWGQETTHRYNVTQGGVLQQRGWAGKQLSSRRTPVLTFSVDLDTENTWQCHSLHFKSTLCFTKFFHVPFFLCTELEIRFHTLLEGLYCSKALRRHKHEECFAVTKKKKKNKNLTKTQHLSLTSPECQLFALSKWSTAISTFTENTIQIRITSFSPHYILME